jgi:3-phenylpropionate/trans-cinnamate dioxygenase ferredoxin subunit
MRVEIAPIADLPNERGIRVEVGEDRIAVFRSGDEVHAIGDRCSHAEASLSEGDLFDGEVECPRHGSPFDLTTGEPGALPATSPVPVYPVVVEDGVVYLTVEGAS